LFSVSPTAKAAQSSGCSAQAGAHARQAPAQPARSSHRYLVAVRMGWMG
jgi:hypothetical protein